MEIYIVGGAVRDKLLGLEPKDVDYVVVGASEDEMLALGYSKVGADFPVFLHPTTGDEYALARTERKTKRGYHGFEVDASKDVTLVDDLLRRDLSINAMAMDEHGNLFDPHGGLNDLNDGILRHTSLAFAEDPVRVLRLARFLARYKGFTVAPETVDLVREMVKSGELDSLVPERIWAEFAKGLMEKDPWPMIEFLYKTGALAVVAPSIKTAVEMWYVADWLNAAVKAELGLGSRFAMLAMRFNDGDYESLRVPTDIMKLSVGINRHGASISGLVDYSTAREAVQVFHDLDILRNPKRFEDVVNTVLAVEGNVYSNTINRSHLMELAEAYNISNAGEIAKSCKNVKDIRDSVAAARLKSVDEAIDRIRSNK